jgi:PAS domain S-box-containing protein
MQPLAALTVGDVAIASIAVVLALFELTLLSERPGEREHVWVAVICATTATFATAMATHYNAGPALALSLTRIEAVSLLLMVHALPLFAAEFTRRALPLSKRLVAASALVWCWLALSPWMIPGVDLIDMPGLGSPFYRRPQTPLLIAAQVYGLLVVVASLGWLIRHRDERRVQARYWMAAFAGWGITSGYMFLASNLGGRLYASVVEYGMLAFAGALVAKDARLHAARLGEVERARAAAESRQQVAEALYREIVDAVGEGIVWLDDDGGVRVFNPVMSSMTDVSEAQARGRMLPELLDLDPALADRFEESRRRVREGGAEVIELTTSRRKLSCTLSPFVPSEGRQGVLVVIRDDTEQQELVVRMMDLDRMVAVGTLAAGIGHEINNPLAYVLVNLEHADKLVAKMAQEETRELAELIERSADGAGRIRDIVASLRSFSRQDERRRAVDVAESLRAAVRIASNEIRHRATLREEIVETRAVRGNAARVSQVFVNLLINAAHAIPDGHADEHEIRVRLFANEDEVVCEVSDTGKGLPPELREKIFDPFFTTKPLGQGTGLGLSIARDTVQAMGGRIEVATEPTKGTTFRVVLPAVDELAVDSSKRTPMLSPVEEDGLRVLLVDDELELLRALRRALGDWEVELCSSGGEAIERLAKGEGFDAVVTDLMMRDMNGMELFAEIEDKYPEVADSTLFMTGGAFTPGARAFCEAHAERVLDKPIDIDDLRRRIVAARDGSGRRAG